MSVRLLDRLSGKVVCADKAGVAVMGRYLIDSPAGSSIFLNDIAAGPMTYLVPDSDGRFALLETSGARAKGQFAGGQSPDGLEASSIRKGGRIVEEALNRQTPWAEWLDLSPLVPEMSKRVEMLALESLLERRLGHLGEVCRRPRAHLRVEVERLPVARAQRFHARAASFLAAHTEDWERPTLRSVVPKRILSLVRDDQLDIYENRIAVRLVDHLLA
ncbi:MAG: hypothetical protein R3B70_45695, partial [Polyangiaceae bacterium]